MRYQSEISIHVRCTEIDVNGHVNNAKYLEYLEWGREDWYEQFALDYNALKELGIATVVARVTANYRRESKQNDALRIRTHLAKVGNTSCSMVQTIWNQDDMLIVDAEFIVVTVDTQTRTPVPVPNVMRQS